MTEATSSQSPRRRPTLIVVLGALFMLVAVVSCGRNRIVLDEFDTLPLPSDWDQIEARESSVVEQDAFPWADRRYRVRGNPSAVFDLFKSELLADGWRLTDDQPCHLTAERAEFTLSSAFFYSDPNDPRYDLSECPQASTFEAWVMIEQTKVES